MVVKRLRRLNREQRKDLEKEQHLNNVSKETAEARDEVKNRMRQRQDEIDATLQQFDDEADFLRGLT
jgi:hypothetical protein